MYLNIEKSDIDFVEESYYQPNVIRLKPSSKANILVNRLNIPVSKNNNTNDIENKESTNLNTTSSDENKNIEKIVVAETKTANLFIFDQDSVMNNTGSKPINLNAKMFENVAKKHDEYMKKIKNLESNTISNDSNNQEFESSSTMSEVENNEINSVFNAIDSVINDTDIQIENTIQEEIEDEFAGLNTTTNKFIELVNEETQTEKDLSIAKEQFTNVSKKLEEATEIEKHEIVRKYELEEAIKTETKRQREILQKQSEIVNSRLVELKKEKADIDMQVEEKNSELESTNINIGNIKKENTDLASIYEAIVNSYENRYEEASQENSISKAA